MSATAAVTRWSSQERLIVVAAALLFAGVVINTAWISDDAYITFRTIDNVLHGFGARWNVAERVQAFTHPLWMLALTALEVVTREPYFTAIAASVALSLVTVWLLATRVAASAWSAAIAIVVLATARSFVDFSTSGLENPLAHCLIVAFVVSLTTPSPGRWPFVLASLVMLCRQDLVCLIGPALALYVLKNKPARSMRSLLIGFSPLIAWEIFSIAYYGFPVPNTLFAKLGTGIPKSDLIVQGLYYLAESWLHDPLTLVVIAGSILCGLVRAGVPRALAAGQLANLAYVVWIGGDFMSGRFLSAPFVLAIAQLASVQIRIRALHVAILVAVVAIEITVKGSGVWPGVPQPYQEFHGITDERAYYYGRTGLLRSTGTLTKPDLVDADLAAQMRAAGQTVATREMVGMFGYAAGAKLYVVDRFGLGDPLLARLPVTGAWRIGHFPRELPDGYIQTLRSGANQIVDPRLRAYYDSLTLVTRGAIWSPARWRAIVRLNLGLDFP